MTMTKSLVTTVLTLAIAGLLVLPAGAHTAMLRASPDRDATVGGSIGVIDLEFLDAITDAVVTVTYNGTLVSGRTTVAEGKVITFTFDQALVQPGRYQVNYEMISTDGDFTTGGYFFTFDPLAEQPGRIDPSGSDGFPIATLALPAVGLVAIIGLISVTTRRSANRRREPAF